LGQERYRDARTLLLSVRLQLGRQGRELVVGGLPLYLMAAAAGLDDWEDFDHQLRRGEAMRGHGPEVSEDALWAARQAAHLAEAAGKRSRVARTTRLVSRLGQGARLVDKGRRG